MRAQPWPSADDESFVLLLREGAAGGRTPLMLCGSLIHESIVFNEDRITAIFITCQGTGSRQWARCVRLPVAPIDSCRNNHERSTELALSAQQMCDVHERIVAWQS